MANIDSGFSVDILSLSDLNLITSGSLDPSSAGYEAPLGSLYLRDNGIVYRKSNVSDTDWSDISAGGGGLNVKYFTVTTATRTILNSELIVGINIFGVNFAGNVSISLKNDIAEAKIITIKDESGLSSSNNITIDVIA